MDNDFGVSENNLCTFDAECMEFGVTYEIAWNFII